MNLLLPIAVFTALLLPVTSAALEVLTGKVIGITDGDTLTVLVNRQPVKIRLAEIDAPERAQPWSKRAKQALSEKVYEEVVRVEVTDTDRYSQSVGHVFLGDREINREMVREGHAWTHRKYLRDQSLLRDEEFARANLKGLTCPGCCSNPYVSATSNFSFPGQGGHSTVSGAGGR